MGHCVSRIENQIQHNLLCLREADADFPSALAKFHIDVNVFTDQMSQQWRHFPHRMVAGYVLRRVLFLPAHAHELADQASAVLRGNSNFFYFWRQRIRLRQFPLHELAVQENASQQIVEIVRYPSNQAADQRQVLPLRRG